MGFLALFCFCVSDFLGPLALMPQKLPMGNVGYLYIITLFLSMKYLSNDYCSFLFLTDILIMDAVFFGAFTLMWLLSVYVASKHLL